MYLTCRNISTPYTPNKQFSYTFSYPGIYCLYGPNGIGKTSLLSTMAGLLSLHRGHIERNDQISSFFLPHSIKLPQTLYTNEIMELWKVIHESNKNSTYNRPVKAMSFGEKKLFYLEQLSMTKASLFFLDEPFSGLDTQSQEKTSETLCKLVQHACIIITGHTQHPIATHALPLS